MIVLLDNAPLGLISNPSASMESLKCLEWINYLLLNGATVVLPEIVDYETRRELIRANKINGINRLNTVKQSLRYEPITTEIMLKAAELWAWARKTGQQTARDEALDADVILAAQAIVMALRGEYTVIATDNVKHLARYTSSKKWMDIKI